MNDKKEITEEEQQKWIREQYLVATKYLAGKGLVADSVSVDESRYLVPIFSVWKIKLFDKQEVWVICGDLPTDHSSIDVAPTAREAVRHFSLKWQMQAENLLRADSEEQTKFAQLLVGRAEGLYQMFENDKLWNVS